MTNRKKHGAAGALECGATGLLLTAILLHPVQSSAQVAPARGAVTLGPGMYRVAGVEFIGLDAELEQRIRSTLRVRAGDSVTAEGLRTIRSDLHGLNDRLTVASAQRPGEQAPNERILVIRLVSPRTAAEIPLNPMRIDPATQMKSLSLRVLPEYSAEVREGGIRGEVLLDTTVGTDGLVKDVRVVSGDSRLAAAAMAAVEQWVFRPQVVSGQLVAVITEIRVSFTPAPAPAR